MTATIQNEKVIVSISDNGAELQSVRLKEDNTEYLWQGDSTYWGAAHQFYSQLSAD